jgi:hypothetical protein
MLSFDNFYFILTCTLDRKETGIHCSIYECKIVGLANSDCCIYICVTLTLLWLAIIDFTTYLEI